MRARLRTLVSVALLGGAAALGTACFTRVGDPSNPTPEGRPCAKDDDCPQPSNPCQVWTCWQEVCTPVAAAKDTLIAREAQIPGDCKVLVCDGQGKTMALADKTDEPPEDENPCAEEVCEDGNPVYPPVEAGAPCGKSGVCNGKGKCGVCLPEAQRCKGNKPETCSEEGEWASQGPCPDETPICSGVACIGVRAVTAGDGFSCGLLDDQKVRCFGSPSNGKLGSGGAFRVPGLFGVAEVTAGARHTCALLSSGEVKCWGENGQRQLGDDTKEHRGWPAPVPKVFGATKIAAGQYFTCTLVADGAVTCWGSNEFGQLGAGPATKPKVPVAAAPEQTGSSDRPAEVVSLLGVEQISLGRDHGCALISDTGVACWGSNDAHALGHDYPPPQTRKEIHPMMTVPLPPVATKPVLLPAVKGVKRAVEVAAGFDHACARLADGSVTCWGHNHHGQLGDGSTKDSASPVKVKDLTGAVGLALGGDHSCAVMSDGAVKCWGRGASGELGDPAKTDHPEPFAVPDLAGVGALSSGATHLCARLQSGSYACWGDNAHGELGSGSAGDKPSPIVW